MLGDQISLTNYVAKQVISVTATQNQTDFTVEGGYRINQLGVYRNGEHNFAEAFTTIETEDAKPLFVPFAIPPMLARWDRALWDLRQDWDAELRGEFPVPAGEPDRVEQRPEEKNTSDNVEPTLEAEAETSAEE